MGNSEEKIKRNSWGNNHGQLLGEKNSNGIIKEESDTVYICEQNPGSK